MTGDWFPSIVPQVGFLVHYWTYEHMPPSPATPYVSCSPPFIVTPTLPAERRCAARELLVLLAARGMNCPVSCAAALGHEPGTSPDDVLGSLGLSANQLQAELSGCR